MQKQFRHSIVLFLLFAPLFGAAQTNPEFYDYPQNHLPWFTVESEYFLVHFQEGNSRSARTVAKIADEIYPPITELYRTEPDEKVSIILKDREDYSNGAAYFFDNKIEIWLPALDTPLRGTHDWLRNVIAHEFTHIVQLQLAMKRSRKWPMTYLQWLSYENVRRPDVLYGYPNGIITMPFISVNVPAWLAEGTAQYQRQFMNYDNWDAHRDMILRTRILSDTYFSLDEMGTFSSKSSLERETVYNQGYAFVFYLANRFGEQILPEITSALSARGTYNVAAGIKQATGIPGHEVFSDWIAERKEFYSTATRNLPPASGIYIEKKGEFNFHPKISPDSRYTAYISNKGRDESVTSLYLKATDGTETEAAVLNQQIFHAEEDHFGAFSRPVIDILSTNFTFSPDSKKLAYSVNKLNKFGEYYRDIFIYSADTKKTTRLTRSARVQSPAWSPGGTAIAAVQYHDATQNIVLIDAESGVITPLTSYSKGETVFTPAWSPDGSEIYFSAADRNQRTLRAVSVSDGTVRTLFENEQTDFRDPFISPDNRYIYFSASFSGIFNIYRASLNNTSNITQITGVTGGAFMPFVSESGTLLYAEYEADGYKIKKTMVSETVPEQRSAYAPSYSIDALKAELPPSGFEYLNRYNDSDIEAFSVEEEARVQAEGELTFTLPSAEEEKEYTYRKYNDVYTSFSIMPVLRFDNYTKLHGNNGALIKNGQLGRLGKNLLRDVKPGLYFNSQDVLGKVSVFGGVMLGVGSLPADGLSDYLRPGNLLGLDRDIFLTAEHRGIPFIKRSWSPTVAVEIYNMHRNVKDGLSVEEFRCTSCAVPDTIHVDIAYDIWEVDLFLRSKLNQRSLLEFGISYTPYRVSTDNFYSNELKAFITGSTDQYFKGNTFSAAYTVDYYDYSGDADIAPVGLKGYLRYQYQPSKLLDSYDIKDGALVPVYKSVHNQSAELHMRYGFRLPAHQAVQARIRGFSYFNKTKDSFYADYIGGFTGMRSYPFFALGGEQTAFSSLSYFAPLIRNMAAQAGPLTIDKLFARVFFEAGNSWNSTFNSGRNLKTGIGTELRLAMNGYYLAPLKFFVSAAYGFNDFTITLPEDFVTGTDSNTVRYGKELLFHFGLTFDFELL